MQRHPAVYIFTAGCSKAFDCGQTNYVTWANVMKVIDKINEPKIYYMGKKLQYQHEQNFEKKHTL